MGVAVGDVDNDGLVDLFLTYLGKNRLYHNNGDGTFSDVSASSGIDAPGWGISASFLDYDRDGWLDLYVGNYVRYDFAADRKCTVLSDRRSYCGPEHYDRQTDRLYRNRGNGERHCRYPGAGRRSFQRADIHRQFATKSDACDHRSVARFSDSRR